MKAVIVGKWIIGWTKGWAIQPEKRFRIGLAIYKTYIKVGYLVVAKKV